MVRASVSNISTAWDCISISPTFYFSKLICHSILFIFGVINPYRDSLLMSSEEAVAKFNIEACLRNYDKRLRSEKVDRSAIGHVD